MTSSTVRLARRVRRLRRLTATTTAGGMMLVGSPVLMPTLMDYVVQPGDTLSEIAERHQVPVDRLVRRNALHPSGDRIVAGQRLRIPSAHGPGGGVSGGGVSGGGDTGGDTGGGSSSAVPDRISADARKIVRYTVRPGDTPSGLAVRFHAWTAELIELNGATLRVGERIRIPVVLAAVAEERRRTRDRAAAPSSRTGGRPEAETERARSTPGQRRLQARLADREDPSRAEVRRIIERTARRYGVDPQLALAISWQEAGWQQHHVSHASAIGAMQVVPATGEWMSGVVGRELDLLDVHDNVTAGVALLKVLTDAAPRRKAVAGYYQGLAGVRRHGMYDDTKRYVANVLHLRRAFTRGDYPG